MSEESKKEIIEKVWKDVFKIYGNEKYRIQFNKADKMIEDLIKISIDKTINELKEKADK